MRWPIAGRWRLPSLLAAALLILLAMALAALAAYSGYAANSTTAPGTTTHPSSAQAGASGRTSTSPTTRSGTTSTSSPTGTTTAAWTVYHEEPDGAGDATGTVTFSSASPAWSSPALDGQTYGEPLEVDGRVIVATENDTVYALAADNGTILWSTHLATPVPASSLPCGDISPTVGITGTPVIDPTRGEVFVVADELSGGTPSHHLVGLDLFTGAVEVNTAVDPPGANTAALLQRTGLALDDGNVVFGFGGNYGDCGDYHGWVESAPETGGSVSRFELDAGTGERQGAVWMGGAAPEVDAGGNIWVAVGNGSVTSASSPYDGSDSVDELSPTLQLEQYFSPSSWPSDNANDYDLGSTAPALLGDGTVFQVGKSETGYLMETSHLGGIGGQVASGHVCTGDADGGDAVSGTTVYAACKTGLEAVATSDAPVAISVQWTAASHPTGPPIVAGGLVWSIGTGTLYGIAPESGATEVQLSVGTEANHFPTPSVADGLLLAPGGPDGNEVLAFTGSAGLPAAPSPAPSTATSP